MVFLVAASPAAADSMPLDAVGGDSLVASGPYGARVSLQVAYWFTSRGLRVTVGAPGRATTTAQRSVRVRPA